jgi:sugar phosphate isomerase/epimerase
MGRTPELIASYWTLAGDVTPFVGAGTSPHSFQSRVEAAARAGYKGFGLHDRDLKLTVGRLGYPAMRAILADNGIRYLEIEALLDWFTEGERRQQSDVARRDMLTAAEHLGVYQIKVAGDLHGGAWTIDVMADAFRDLCREAAEAGTRVSLEILPFSNVADVSTGVSVVERTAGSNGGLLLDIWHFARGKLPYSDIATIPPPLIAAVEIDDGPADPVGPLLEDSIDNRLLCGEGAFDVPDFLGWILRSGYQGPVGVEILSQAHRARGLDEAARASFDAAIRQFPG